MTFLFLKKLYFFAVRILETMSDGDDMFGDPSSSERDAAEPQSAPGTYMHGTFAIHCEK